MDSSKVTTEDLNDQILALQRQVQQRLFEDDLKRIFISRKEARDHILELYGKDGDKTLVADTSVYKCGHTLGVKCKNCDSFKMFCKLCKGQWVYVKEKCNYTHDAQCIGTYKPRAVSSCVYF